MAARLTERLRRVEAVRRPPRGGVLVQRAGESVEDTLRRAQSAGRTGAFIVLPPAPSSVDDWSKSCSDYMAQQQRDSAAEIERLLDATRARS